MKKSKFTFLSLFFAFAVSVPVAFTGATYTNAKIKNSYTVGYKKEFNDFMLEKVNEATLRAGGESSTEITTEYTDSSKNYFELGNLTSTENIVKNEDNTLSVTVTEAEPKVATSQTLSELCPELEAGKKYALNFESTGSVKYIYLEGSSSVWNAGSTRTLTSADLSGTIAFYVNGEDDTSVLEATVSNITLNRVYNVVTAPTLESNSFTYDGNEKSVTSTFDSSKMTETGTKNATIVGSYTLTYTISDPDYVFDGGKSTYSLTWTIDKATDNAITEIVFEDFVYGASPKPATVKAKYGSENVVFTIDGEETDFSDLSLNAGKHTLEATIAGTANYNGATLSKEFTVSKKTVTASELPTVSGSYVYNGTVQNVTINGEKDYLTITGDKSGTNAGTYTLTIGLKNDTNYEFDTDVNTTINWTIAKAQLVAPTITTGTFTYNAKAQSVALSGFDSATMNVSGNTATNVGNYTAVVTLSDSTNYEWSTAFDGNLAWSITKATKELPTLDNVMYNGKNQTASVEETDEYTVVTNNGGTNVGTYNVTIKMSDELFANYKWATTDTQEVTITFEITKATDNTITGLTITGWTYGEKAVAPTATAKYGTVTYTYEGVNGTTYTASATAPTNAGTYKVIASVSETENYNGVTSEKEFTISKVQIAKPSENTTKYVYSAEEKTYTLTTNSAYTIKNNKRTNAGSQTVTVSLNDTTNYEWADGTTDNITFTFAISKAQLVVPTIENGTFTYDGTDKTLELNGFDDSTMTISDNIGTNAGSYTAKVTLKDTTNYEWGTEFDGNISWSIAKIKIETPQKNTDVFTFDGTEQTYTLTANSAYTIKNNKRTNAGSQTVTVSLNDTTNYEWTDGTTTDVTYTFTIDKAVVETIPTISGSYTYTGETITLVLNNFDDKIMTISDNTGINAGNYTANITLDENHKWAEEFDGNISWSIQKAKLVVPSVTTNTFTYTGSEQTLLLNDCNSNVMSIVDNSKTNVGEYTAIVTLTDSNNYEWAEEFDGNISWSITKATNKFNSLTITGWSLDDEPNAPIYDVDFGTPTFKYVGVGETTYESATAPTSVGNYKLVATVVATENYDGAEYEVTFSVAGASNSISNLVIAGWTYGNYDEVTNKPSATALHGEITYYYVNRGETSYSDENLTVPTNAGEYTVIAVVVGTFEYAGAESSYDFVIEQAEVLQADKPTIDGEYTYNGTEQSVVVSGKTDYMTLKGEIAGTNAKTYTITIELDANHKWADGVNNTISWTINKATATISDISIKGWIFGQYDAETNKPTASTTFGVVRYVYLNSEFEEVSDIANANAGTYTLKALVDGTDNYFGVENSSVTFTIGKAEVGVVPSVKADANFVYNATEQTLNISDIENFDESIMTIVNGTNKHTNAGAISVEIKLDSNHVWADNKTDTITIDWIIEKAQITISNLTITGWIYGEYNAETNTPSASAQFNANVSYKYLDSTGIEVSDLLNADAGTYTLVATVQDDENGNYVGTTTEIEFVVSKKVVNVLPVAENAVYTGEVLTASLQNFDNSYMTIVENSNKRTNAGRYTIYISLDSNHTWANGIDGEIEWVIEQQTISTNPTLTETSLVYNGNTQSVQVVGLADGILTSATNLSGVNAGSYEVTITINPNYKWADGFDGTLIWTITKATDNEIKNLAIVGWKYGEKAVAPTATAKYGKITYTYEGVNGTTYASSSAVPTMVGNYKVTANVADSTNYNSCTASIQFEITKGNVIVNETPQSKIEGEEGAFNLNVPENSGVLVYYAPTGTTNWSTTVPTSVGVYDVKVVVESTNNNYNELEKVVVAGFTISAKVVPAPAPTEPKDDNGLTSSQIGIIVTVSALCCIAIAIVVILCIHRKNTKRAKEFLDEQDEDNKDR